MGRASRPRGSAKVIAQADPVEIERPRPAGITLSRGTEVPQTARARRTKLNILHVKGAYDGIKPQPSAQNWTSGKLVRVKNKVLTSSVGGRRSMLS